MPRWYVRFGLVANLALAVSLSALAQGLADTFCLLKMPFESEAARQLNKDIFEVRKGARAEGL